MAVAEPVVEGTAEGAGAGEGLYTGDAHRGPTVERAGDEPRPTDVGIRAKKGPRKVRGPLTAC